MHRLDCPFTRDTPWSVLWGEVKLRKNIFEPMIINKNGELLLFECFSMEKPADLYVRSSAASCPSPPQFGVSGTSLLTAILCPWQMLPICAAPERAPNGRNLRRAVPEPRCTGLDQFPIHLQRPLQQIPVIITCRQIGHYYIEGRQFYYRKKIEGEFIISTTYKLYVPAIY